MYNLQLKNSTNFEQQPLVSFYAVASILFFYVSFFTIEAETLEGLEFQQFRSTFDKLTTVAGKGAEDRGIHWKDQMELGSALEAELSRPHMAMGDREGNIYIADKENHAIRLVNEEGFIHTVAGINQPGDGPDSLSLGNTVALHDPVGSQK